MVIVGRGDLVCTAGYSWHEDVCFSWADQPLATEAAAADAAAVAVIRNSSLMLNLTVPADVKKPLGSGFSERIVMQ